MNGQLSAIPVLLGPGQASYLVICGKKLAARYRSGESLSFMGDFFKESFIAAYEGWGRLDWKAPALFSTIFQWNCREKRFYLSLVVVQAIEDLPDSG